MTTFKEFKTMSNILQQAFAGEFKERQQMIDAAEKLGVCPDDFDYVLEAVLETIPRKG